MISAIGEVLRGLIPLPIPAGIYGFILLFIGLCTGLVKLPDVEEASNFMVENLIIFLLPACVEIMAYWSELRGIMAALIVTVIASTLFVLTVTGKASDAIIDLKGEKRP
ncbi:MAG: CidA/LrgA family protein [Oscillospiraceae bacterium]